MYTKNYNILYNVNSFIQILNSNDNRGGATKPSLFIKSYVKLLLCIGISRKFLPLIYVTDDQHKDKLETSLS